MNKKLYPNSHEDFREQKIFKKSKIPLTNKILYLKSYDNFLGPGTENFKNSKTPIMNKKLYLKHYDDFRVYFYYKLEFKKYDP